MEKKRRARINASLAELKSLLLDVMKAEVKILKIRTTNIWIGFHFLFRIIDSIQSEIFPIKGVFFEKSMFVHFDCHLLILYLKIKTCKSSHLIFKMNSFNKLNFFKILMNCLKPLRQFKNFNIYQLFPRSQSLPECHPAQCSASCNS